ncbi:MAG: hydroxymethylbilane synthase [Eubacterium sp.]
MAYFPFMIQLEDKKCLLVGGGKVAARKAEIMLDFGADVFVVADKICGKLWKIQKENEKLMIRKRAYQPEDLEGADVVILATDDSKLNSEVAAICKQRRILVNVVDVKKDCGFYFPAIIQQKDVVVAVSTGGNSPGLASKIKNEIKKHLRKDYGEIADELGKARELVMHSEFAEEKRREILLEMMNEKLENNIIRIGTRGSDLARIQTEMVIQALKEKYPMYHYETVILTTKGDRQTDRPITAFGGKAVFVEEIEQALQNNTIDIAVHSAKDMPNPCGEGLAIAGTLPRACVQDVLIYRKGKEITRKTTFTVGTGSLRRRCQIREMYPKAHCQDLRGNVGTRIRKLKEGRYDAIVLAAAGIKRQGLDEDAELQYEYLPEKEMLPAAGQAIIAMETRKDGYIRKLVEEISDQESSFELEIERAVLTELQAGCHEPIGVLCRVFGEEMSLDLMIGKDELVHRVQLRGKKENWEKMVKTLCQRFR